MNFSRQIFARSCKHFENPFRPLDRTTFSDDGRASLGIRRQASIHPAIVQSTTIPTLHISGHLRNAGRAKNVFWIPLICRRFHISTPNPSTRKSNSSSEGTGKSNNGAANSRPLGIGLRGMSVPIPDALLIRASPTLQ